MIVFELNGDITYMVPLLFAVLLSYAISNSLAMSIFDVLLDMKDLPYLPALRSEEHYKMKASDFMNKNFLYLSTESELEDIIALLQHLGPRAKSIPVVQTNEDKLLLYSVQAQSLRKYLFTYYHTVSHTFTKETQEKLNKYFYSLYSVSQNTMKEFNKQKIASPKMDQTKQNLLSRRESALKVRDFNQSKIRRDDSESNSDDSITEDFWSIKINFEHELLELERAPFTVFEETSLAQIHFLFTMLNISQLFVIRKGIIVGIITKNAFLKKK